MKTNEMIDKIAVNTANRKIKWEKYTNNSLNFHCKFDTYQHFLPNKSWITKTTSGLFLLACFQAPILPSDTVEKNVLYYFQGNSTNEPSIIEENSISVLALLKTIEIANYQKIQLETKTISEETSNEIEDFLNSL